MFGIGEILKIDIFLSITTHTIKKGDQTWSCVELVMYLFPLHFFDSYGNAEDVTRDNRGGLGIGDGNEPPPENKPKPAVTATTAIVSQE